MLTLAVVGGLLDELADRAIDTSRLLTATTLGWDMAVLGHGELAASKSTPFTPSRCMVRASMQRTT